MKYTKIECINCREKTYYSYEWYIDHEYTEIECSSCNEVNFYLCNNCINKRKHCNKCY